MKKTKLFITALLLCIGVADAAVRDANTVTRNTSQSVQNTVSRDQPSASQRTTIKTVNRTPVQRTTTPQVTSRTTTKKNQRSAATTVRSATTRPTNQTSKTTSVSVARSGKQVLENRKASLTSRTARPSRAATIIPGMESNTFGTGYTSCRDAYFTCMDQFCAAQNDTYRRCACSSRLGEIKQRENLLSQTANQLQDFQDFNISLIDKTSAEVTAMISASSGEALASNTQDKSTSAQQLANISNVLSKTKSQALSTAGTLDAGGDINQIWTTTDLADGANIANLTGESLYNAVHSQCVAMVSQSCSSSATLNMVVSAYGMYIENDCSALVNTLDTKINAAKGNVRQTEREMHSARLDNYNAHNSVYINDCVANVRKDLTSKNACGPDFIHCLDVSGRYLYRETGEPIYSPEFYQLDGQISLSGDTLSNQNNRLIIAELNRMRAFAANSLDKCRDISEQVWDEFMRQAIAEIYQGQQERIRRVKTDCLNVVNACYDEQNQSLKDFSNIKEQLLLGQRMELSEELCQEKLDACSNLHGGGPNGLKELIVAVHEITDAKIAQNCKEALQDYTRDLCSTPSNDTLHSYPYACRVYAPGEQKYAQNAACNQQIWDRYNQNQIFIQPNLDEFFNDTTMTQESNMPADYTCDPTAICYTSCLVGFYLSTDNGIPTNDIHDCPDCKPCPEDAIGCPGGSSPPQYLTDNNQMMQEIDPDLMDTCGEYAGSMYQRLVRYALQTCVRPSDANNADYTISIDVLQDVNSVMDQFRIDMGKNLASECDRLGGLWIDSAWVDAPYDERLKDGTHDITGDTLHKAFYDETGANSQWGYCAHTIQNTETTTQ